MKKINMVEFIKLVRKHVPVVNTIVEIGALHAKDSIYFKSQYPDARVIAFEALTDNFNKYMIHLKDIECHNILIFNINSIIPFHIKKANGIHSIFDRGQKYGTLVEPMACRRLDCIINSPIDVLKIDVEGATYEVLEGMGKLLDTVKIMHIETESSEFFKGQKLHCDVVKLLLNRNFKMIWLTSMNICDNKKQHDSVWIRK